MAGGRTCSQTLCRLRRARMRDLSPAVEVLSVSDSEVLRISPCSAFSLLAASDGGSREETEDDAGVEELWGDDNQFGQVTERADPRRPRRSGSCGALVLGGGMLTMHRFACTERLW